jgi:hypothetical protein
MHWKIFELHNAPVSSSWDVVQAGYEPVDFTSGSFTALPINDLLAGAIQQDSQLRYDALRAGAAVPQASKPPITITNTDQQLPKELIPAGDNKQHNEEQQHSQSQSPTTTVPPPPSINKKPAPSQQQQFPIVDTSVMDFDIVIEAADNPPAHQHVTYKDDDVINHDFYTTITQMSPTQPDQPPAAFTTTTMAPPPAPIPPTVVPRQPRPLPPASSLFPAMENTTTTIINTLPAAATTRKTDQFRLPRPAPSAAQGSRGAQLKELLEQKPVMLLNQRQYMMPDAEKEERSRRLKEAIWADFNGDNVEGSAVTEVKQRPPIVAAQPFHAQQQQQKQQQRGINLL